MLGTGLIGLGVAVFAIRLQHAGAYAVPSGGVMLGGLAAMLLGVVLLGSRTPRVLIWLVLAASPLVLFASLYAILAELGEVVSLYAADREGRSAELRLWIADREDGEWVGMPRSKAVEHALDGARVELLRNGSTRCVVPALHEDRATVRAIHALKLEKYAVARAASAIGLYPRDARASTVSLRLDPCPEG